MTVLGIETATDVCASAVVCDGKVLGESILQEPHVHAEMLMSQIDEVVRTLEGGVRQIDGIAVSIGPGSFTGLRIGLSVAKGLAWSMGKKLVPVPTLRALARNVVDNGGFDLPMSVLPVLDARRDEVYCQLFQADAQGLIPLWTEKTMTLEFLMTKLGDLDVLVTGAGASKFREYAKGRSNARQHFRYPPATIARCSAATIALEGEEELKRGHCAEIASLEPLYIMEFPVKVPFQV